MDAYSYYQAGKDMMKKGKLDDAIAQLELSIALLPHFKSLELLGECFMKQDRHKEAVVPLAAATALNNGVRAPSLLAEVFMHLKEYADAHSIAELALQRDPNNRSAKHIKEHSKRASEDN